MHAVNLIASALRKQDDCPVAPDKRMRGICCATGQEEECVLRKEKLEKSFTNTNVLVAPSSEYIGVDAYIALSYKWERTSSWWCDGIDFKRIRRVEIRDMILNGVNANHWTGYVTTSYKKHGALWAKVNDRQFGLWRFEMKNVDCRDIAKVREWYNILDEAVHNKIGRTIIETLDCPAYMIDKIGLSRWLEFEKWARPKYQSNLYQFLAYLLPSKEERDNENKPD